MDLTVVAYVVYLLISIGLTVWVARTLSRNGRVFIGDVLHGNEKLADAVNQLLVVGFYLVNIGFVTLFLRSDNEIATARELFEALSVKLGVVLLVLGVMHLATSGRSTRCAGAASWSASRSRRSPLRGGPHPRGPEPWRPPQRRPQLPPGRPAGRCAG